MSSRDATKVVGQVPGRMARSARTLVLPLLFLVAAAASAQAPPVQVVLFTHIEDNTPSGTLGTPQCRQNYLFWRARLIGVAGLMRDRGVPWSLEPDWKILRAALLYEDAELMQTTNGKNFLRYLREDLGTVIDPHSHENGGYNYTDVAHLLDSLGVGATTVIGGHIWDPSLPQFQEWDRFRVPVPGERYPWAWWRGDILMGSGTPNHVNDPIVSGVWRPQDRDHYFTHDSTGNISAVGQYRGTLDGIAELAGLYETGVVPDDLLLTSSYHIKPATISRPDGIAAIDDSVVAPILGLEADGTARATDFTSLIRSWQADFGSRGFIYDAEHPAGADAGRDPSGAGPRLRTCEPNPFASSTTVWFTVEQPGRIRLEVHDVLGRPVATLAEGRVPRGDHAVSWDARGLPSGVYFCRLRDLPGSAAHGSTQGEWRLVLTR
jgi:hypothetical protein